MLFEFLEHTLVDLYFIFLAETCHPVLFELGLVVGDCGATHVGGVFGSVDYFAVEGAVELPFVIGGGFGLCSAEAEVVGDFVFALGSDYAFNLDVAAETCAHVLSESGRVVGAESLSIAHSLFED